MNHENYFDKAIRKPLNELLVELSTNNLDTLASRSKENIPQIVERIINSNYFQVLTRDRVMSYDCHARFKHEIKGGEQRNFWSPLPLSLAPVPNENYLYSRGNLTEAKKSQYYEIIPSRDYSSYSYKWNQLYCIKHADKALQLVSACYQKNRTPTINIGFTCLIHGRSTAELYTASVFKSTNRTLL